MADNIVSSISGFMTPEIIGKLASASGLDRALTGQAVSAGIPTLLSSLADLVTKPGGARKLMNAVSEQPSDLENFASNLIGPAQTATNGMGLLSSLLGNRMPNVLVSGIANLLGVNASSMQTVLGLLTPFVLGGLGRFQHAKGLDADGLARMLGEQKDNIADAIPSGLAGFLRKSGLGEEVIPPRPSVRADTPRVAPAAMKTQSTPFSGRNAQWPYWLLALVALGGLLWALMPGMRESSKETATVTNPATDRSTTAQPKAAEVIYFARPAPNWTSAGAGNEYVNRVIYNGRGEALGNIRDLMMGPDGKAQAVVISVGRYLGIGDKVVAVPFNVMRVEQREGEPRMIVDVVKETIQAAPPFENAPASK